MAEGYELWAESGGHDQVLAEGKKMGLLKNMYINREGRKAQPDLFQALTNLAWIFARSSDATIRNGPKAVELAEEANRLTGDTSPLVLRTLAAAYATNKSFDKALETSRRALQSAQEGRNSELAEAIRREMSLYEAGLPYRAP